MVDAFTCFDTLIQQAILSENGLVPLGVIYLRLQCSQTCQSTSGPFNLTNSCGSNGFCAFHANCEQITKCWSKCAWDIISNNNNTMTEFVSNGKRIINIVGQSFFMVLQTFRLEKKKSIDTRIPFSIRVELSSLCIFSFVETRSAVAYFHSI